jgi:hypothetical protein
MKATESKKTPGRPRKAASGTTTASKSAGAATKGAVRKPTATLAYEPTEDEIRAKAQEIYNERISRGEYGSPADDWYKAVNALKKKK